MRIIIFSPKIQNYTIKITYYNIYFVSLPRYHVIVAVKYLWKGIRKDIK